MNDIIKKYNTDLDSYRESVTSIEAERAKIEARIERANRQLQKLDKAEERLHKPSRYDVVDALAQKLSSHFGLPYEIYGPFGLECETSIYLRKDMSKSICDQKTISIRLRLFGDPENDWMTYDTGKRIDRYAKGSIGELNGYNSVYAPLPKDFNDILKLMRVSGRDGIEHNVEEKPALDNVIKTCENMSKKNESNINKDVKSYAR